MFSNHGSGIEPDHDSGELSSGFYPEKNEEIKIIFLSFIIICFY